MSSSSSHPLSRKFANYPRLNPLGVGRNISAADLIDHLYLVVVPIVLGRGERLWDDLEGIEERFTIEATPSPQGVVHMAMNRRL